MITLHVIFLRLFRKIYAIARQRPSTAWARRNSRAPQISWSIRVTQRWWRGKHLAKTMQHKHSNKAIRWRSTNTNWSRVKLGHPTTWPSPSWLRWWRNTALAPTHRYQFTSITLVNEIMCKSVRVDVWFRRRWVTYLCTAIRKSTRNWCCPQCDPTSRSYWIWLRPVRPISVRCWNMRCKFSGWNFSISFRTLPIWIRCLRPHSHRLPIQEKHFRDAANAAVTWSTYKPSRLGCTAHNAMKPIRCPRMERFGKWKSI